MDMKQQSEKGRERPSMGNPHPSLKVAKILVVSTLNFCCINGSLAKT